MAYIRAINDIYDGTKTWARTVGGNYENFRVVMGLHGVSVLSPSLFALVTAELIWHI